MLPNLSALTLRDDAAPTATRGPAGQAKKRAIPAIPPSERQLLAAERKFHAEITNIEKRRRHFSLGFSVSFSQSPSRFTDSASPSNVTAGKARIHHSPENR